MPSKAKTEPLSIRVSREGSEVTSRTRLHGKSFDAAGAISSFLAAMASSGITPTESIMGKLTSGELVRFRAEGDKLGRRNEWAILHLDGIPAGVFGHYRLGIRSSWRSGAVGPSSYAEQDALIARIAEAQAYGVGRTTIFDSIASGALPSFKVLNKRLIHRIDLEEWIARGGRPLGVAS